jgi:hypothetical protein
VLRVTRELANGVIREEITNDPRGIPSPAVKLRLSSPDRTDSAWLLSSRADWLTTPNDSARIAFLGNAGPVKAFKSTVQIIEHGQVVAQQLIEVNRPLKYRGYHFYQDSYDPRTEAVSTFKVRRDPGLGLVYAGFALMTAGVVYMFYVKPYLLRKGQA